jgi:hypothetical protein
MKIGIFTVLYNDKPLEEMAQAAAFLRPLLIKNRLDQAWW